MSNPPGAARADAKYRDLAGIAVSALCAIHCAVLPLLVATAAASGLAWLYEEGLEWVFLGTSTAIGCASLVPAYRQLHHKKACLALFAGGILTILAGRLAPSGVPDTAFVVFGAGLILTAHAGNQYFVDPAAAAAVTTRDSQSGNNGRPRSARVPSRPMMGRE